MTKRDRLYPNHQHRWANAIPGYPELVTCMTCGFQVPRNLAKFDGTTTPKEPA